MPRALGYPQPARANGVGQRRNVDFLEALATLGLAAALATGSLVQKDLSIPRNIEGPAGRDNFSLFSLADLADSFWLWTVWATLFWRCIALPTSSNY